MKESESTPDTGIEIYISGRVQGVFFRQFTKDAAIDLGLTGYVQNLPDGRVRVVAEGSQEKLNKLIDKLHSGPSLANVENVDVNWYEPTEKFTDFHVRH
ncbi:MAG: acylphosphatase [Methanohalobium sp.]|uniref:acylphosphatase n=1 Tax=Methanohalobium sp. TaxID=2837493 RepID=UPI00397D5544